MTTLRLLLAIALTLSLIWVNIPTSSANDCGRNHLGDIIPCPEGRGDGVRYVYDESTRTIHEVGGIEDGTESEGGGGPVWQTRYMVRCAGNTADNPQNVLCVEATCVASDGNHGYVVLVLRREADADPWEPWPGREAECRAATITESYPLEDIRGEIIGLVEEHYEHIARPTVSVQPAANAVVNIPVLASTDDIGEVGFEIENPVPGVVTAAPSYAWTWSNGTTGEGAGRGYDGINPIDNAGYYPVQTAYAQSGTHSVALTVTWEIGLTVPGLPTITDIEPLVYGADAEFPVRSGRTVLVD